MFYGHLYSPHEAQYRKNACSFAPFGTLKIELVEDAGEDEPVPVKCVVTPATIELVIRPTISTARLMGLLDLGLFRWQQRSKWFGIPYWWSGRSVATRWEWSLLNEGAENDQIAFSAWRRGNHDQRVELLEAARKIIEEYDHA